MAMIANDHDCCCPDSELMEQQAMNYECIRENSLFLLVGNGMSVMGYLEDKQQKITST